MSRGILGQKKDGKNLMLFSFKVREGDEWESNSDDSDYVPPWDGEEEEKSKSHETRKRKKKSKIQSVITDSESDSSCDTIPYAPNPQEADIPHSKSSTSKHKLEKTKPTFFSKSKDIKENVKTKNKRKRQQNHDIGEKESKKMKIDGQITHSWDNLPPEILVRIFQAVINSQGALPFLCRASKVCSNWQSVALNSSLWKTIDLSYGWIRSTEQTLDWLIENRISRSVSINLSSWKNLTIKGFENLVLKCKNLESLCVSYCKKLNAAAIRLIGDHCMNLSHIDLSFLTVTDKAAYVHIIEQCGGGLIHLSLAGNTVKGLNHVLSAIIANCTRLELLDLSNVISSSDFTTLDIEGLQTGCPHMKVLRLTNSKFRPSSATFKVQADSGGFPALEELSLAVGTGASVGLAVNDIFLRRVLKNATKLKLLDLRGCCQITHSGLRNIIAADLEHLYISNCSVARYESIELILMKWQHSMLELDLSWNMYPGMSLDIAMNKLASSPHQSKLQIINLSGTSISCHRVRSLLKGCPNLKSLNLGSCRGLPRGMKKEYSEQLLEELKQDIDTIAEQNGLDVVDGVL
ncbi:unnamed protein product [Owenia fusiformis]|uniref:Uncharacterized protein n=1 Tax=Owenia fusiformis TaxID=6347 RepID=A0A8J1XVI8_OWEFU|nr:unnamed protein product [Owenia fusiformis]